MKTKQVKPLTDAQKVRRTQDIVRYLVETRGYLVILVNPGFSYKRGETKVIAFGYPLRRGDKIKITKRVTRADWRKQLAHIRKFEPTVGWSPNRSETYYRALLIPKASR